MALHKGQTKGQTNGLHKSYFDGSPAQAQATHPIAKPPKPAVPGQTNTVQMGNTQSKGD